VDQEQQPSKQIAGDQHLKRLGVDPNQWTVGDRLLAIVVIVMVLAIVIIAVCGYTGAFGWNWEWTGLTQPNKQRTFWDWLSLLVVPIVLALGGYLFTRSESRRTQSVAEQQSALDRDLADQRTKEDRKTADERRQDDLLQAYLDQIGQLLLDKDRPLRQAKKDDEVRTLARARTVTVLPKLNGERKRSVLQFLYESGLINKNGCILNLREADLTNTNLDGIILQGANLRESDLQDANSQSAEDGLVEANIKQIQEARRSVIGAQEAGVFRSGGWVPGWVRDTTPLVSHPVGALRDTQGPTCPIAIRTMIIRRSLGEYDLGGPNLEEIDLEGANLQGANLKGANLKGAYLRTAFLSKANLFGANLEGACLQNANLMMRASTVTRLTETLAELETALERERRPTLTGLSWASHIERRIRLTEGSHMEALPTHWMTVQELKNFLKNRFEEQLRAETPNLEEANLAGANLEGVNLFGANLKGANLKGVQNITNKELQEGAASLEGATMPNGQKYENWLKDREKRQQDE
jgi:uncharacterized protein YjbI with pentapeptide repeats